MQKQKSRISGVELLMTTPDVKKKQSPFSSRKSSLPPIEKGSQVMVSSKTTPKTRSGHSTKTKMVEKRSSSVMERPDRESSIQKVLSAVDVSEHKIKVRKLSQDKAPIRLPDIYEGLSIRERKLLLKASQRDVYSSQFTLCMDTQVFSSRQNQTKVNNYYSHRVKKHIFKGTDLTPILTQERSIIASAMSSIRDQAMPPPALRSTIARKHSVMTTFDDKNKFLGSGAADSTFKYKSTMRNNASTTISTMPQTQSITAFLSRGSKKTNDLMFDPRAGNSILAQLGQNLHESVAVQLDEVLDSAAHIRTKQKRIRDLVGPAEVEMQLGALGAFSLEGDLQQEHAVKDNETETDTLANSEGYRFMTDDIASFMDYYEKCNQHVLIKSNSAPNIDSKTADYLLGKGNEPLQDPANHLMQIKTKIKLKVSKQYHEDVERKKEEEKKLYEPAIEIKDQFGRVMAKTTPFMQMKKVPNSSRAPKTKPPLQKKKSFIDDQKVYYDADNLYNPFDCITKPTVTDQATIKMMKKYQRWPIPETLLGRTQYRRLVLKIDSLMAEAYNEESMLEWANWRQDVDAPYNTMGSEDELNIDDGADSDVDVLLEPESPLKGKTEKDPNWFDIKILDLQPFRMESMKYFPYRTREGEVPLKLLKVPKLDFLIESGPKIQLQQKDAQWSRKLIQNVFNYYLLWNKAPPMEDFTDYLDATDPSSVKLSIKNIKLDDNTAKTLACIIPFLVEIQQVELLNNQITDSIAGAITMACYANPRINRIHISYNFLRKGFGRTLASLSKMRPEKLQYLNIMGSAGNPEHVMPVVNSLEKMRLLKSLNLAGCGLNQHSCRIIYDYLVNSQQIREIDFSHCKLSHQATRYIIDAMNRNTTIRNFNFSNNDMSSQSFEFSIKIGSMISRHPSLMHLNITNTNLKREEIIFIGLSLTITKTIQSLHMTASTLPYYERIFLRSIIAARLSYQYRHQAGKKQIKSNREKNLLFQMGNGEVQHPQLQQYIEVFKDLDVKREGLDFEIQDLLRDIDMQAQFENTDPQNTSIASFDPKSNVGMLIQKIIARQKQIEQQKHKLIQIMGSEKGSMVDKGDMIESVNELSKLNAQEFGQKIEQAKHQEQDNEDLFKMQEELRVERERKRVEQELRKKQKDRSAGELALMFMGINQVAYDLLVENPMTGYMNDIIFSRVLGNDDIEQGAFWTDGTQCFLCQKWNKIVINYEIDVDSKVFAQKLQTIDKVHQNIQLAIEQHNKGKEEDIEVIKLQSVREGVGHDVDSSYIEEVPEEMEVTTRFKSTANQKAGFRSGMKMTGLMRTGNLMHGLTLKSTAKLSSGTEQNHTQTPFLPENFSEQSGLKIKEVDTENKEESESSGGELLSVEEQSLQETELEEVEKPHTEKVDNTNNMILVKKQENMLKRQVLPETINEMCDFDEMNLEDSYEEMDFKDFKSHRPGTGQDDRRHNINVKPIAGNLIGLKRGKTSVYEQVAALKNKFLHIQDGSSSEGGAQQYQTSIISTREHKRQRGEPLIVERVIFFEGMVYQIEEEIYSDSDHSSVYTSEDSFEEDDTLQSRFKQQNPQVNRDVINTPGSALNSMTNLDGFIDHRNNIQKMIGKVDDSRPETQSQEHKPIDGIFIETPHDTGTQMELKPVGNIKIDLSKVEDASAELMEEKLKQGSVDKSPKQEKADNTPKKSVKSGDATPKKSKQVEKPEAEKTSKEGQTDKTKKVRKKAVKAKKVNKKKEFWSNSPGLTQEQDDYESKINPRHFRLHVMEKRMVRFDEIEKEKAKELASPNSVNPVKQPEKLEVPVEGFSTAVGSRDQSTAVSKGAKPETQELFVVASFNDWSPMRMKTLRTLHLEKYGLNEEDIPKELFSLDDQVSVYANMVPSGQHFFYLYQEQGSVFLSPKHEIVRFKSTNVFLNRIIVKPKLEDSLDTIFTAKLVNEEEAVFIKDRSVFADYVENVEQFLLKCLKQDIEYSKLFKLFKNDITGATLQRVVDKLFEHYFQIINIFDFYAGTSDYPRISLNDITSFANKTNILDHQYIGFAALDLLLVASNVSIHKYKKSAERDICRYELLEFIVRTAIFRYQDTKETNDVCDAIDRLLEEYIYPNARYMNGEHFRKYQCYNVKVNEILKRNTNEIHQLYNSFTHSQKKYITCDEAVAFIQKLELNCSIMMIGAMYAESMMTILDNMSDAMICHKMKYVEFLVFLCRITFAHYEKTPHVNEAFYKKLDHMIPLFLGYLNVQPNFQFDEKFQAEIKHEVKLFIGKKRKFMLMQREADSKGIEIDPKIVIQFKEAEKLMKKIGVNPDTIDIGSPTKIEDSSDDEDGKGKKAERQTLMEQQQSKNMGSIAEFRAIVIDVEDRAMIEGVDTPTPTPLIDQDGSALQPNTSTENQEMQQVQLQLSQPNGKVGQGLTIDTSK